MAFYHPGLHSIKGQEPSLNSEARTQDHFLSLPLITSKTM
jgi:hypothetical protein